MPKTFGSSGGASKGRAHRCVKRIRQHSSAPHLRRILLQEFQTVLCAMRGRFGMGLTHPSDWSQTTNFLSQSAKQVVAAANKKPLKR